MAKRKDSTIMPFHYVFQSSLSGATLSLPLSPNAFLSPRLLTEADAWAHFRIREFRFRLLTNDTITAMLCAGYVGGVQDTLPSTLATISELLPSVFRGIQQTVPTEWAIPSKDELAGPLPWYKTIAGTADATEEAPGYIVLSGSTTSSFSLEFRGVMEFKTSLATANTPLAIEMRSRIREERRKAMDANERIKLLKLVSSPTNGGGALLRP